jgi:hypothetical protein
MSTDFAALIGEAMRREELEARAKIRLLPFPDRVDRRRHSEIILSSAIVRRSHQLNAQTRQAVVRSRVLLDKTRG